MIIVHNSFVRLSGLQKANREGVRLRISKLLIMMISFDLARQVQFQCSTARTLPCRCAEQYYQDCPIHLTGVFYSIICFPNDQ